MSAPSISLVPVTTRLDSAEGSSSSNVGGVGEAFTTRKPSEMRSPLVPAVRRSWYVSPRASGISAAECHVKACDPFLSALMEPDTAAGSQASVSMLR